MMSARYWYVFYSLVSFFEDFGKKVIRAVLIEQLFFFIFSSYFFQEKQEKQEKQETFLKF